MDDIILRSRYPRHSSQPKRRRRPAGGESQLNKIILRQVAISVLILVFILIIKGIDTPATNYLTGKVKEMLTQSMDLSGVYKSAEGILGVKSGKKADDGADGFEEEAVPAGGSVPSEAPDENTGDAFATGMVKPVNGVITSSFGERQDPLTNTEKMHYGVDIGADMNASVVAALDGTVIDTGYDKSYGNYVKLDHGNNLFTIYAHCSKITAVKGQKVKQGDTIAEVGDTGRAIGSHLHFEIWKNGTALDPLKYLGSTLS